MKLIHPPKLKGVLPVIPTPFHPDGEIDEKGLRAIVDFAIQQGAGGICSPMFASEFYKLSEEEIRLVTRVVVEQARGRAPVVAQCNHTSLRGVLARVQYAESVGADWIGVLVPCLFPIKAPDIERFYIEICRNTRLPVLAQDADYAGGLLPSEVLVRLCRKTNNFRGVKLEGALNGPRFEMLRRETHGRLALTSGWAGLDIFDAVSRGVDGVVPGAAMTPTYVKCWNAFKRGQSDRGFRAMETFMPLATLAMQNLELLHYIEKYMLTRLGVIASDHVREPTLRVEEGYRRQIRQMADRYFKAAKGG
ncbi:MAG: dihydrodipicolinate synthase family protein [Verrucomicrobia bacterium]|nr:dihydrodipicolinate synthase family protein [Verrucomicrobiota bacterium]